MKYQDKQILNLVQIRARRKLLSIQNALVPDKQEELSAEQLARSIGDRIQVLPAAEQSRLWLKTAVAVAEIEELKGTLGQHRDAIAEELQKLRGHQTAAGAYRRLQNGPKRGR
jgi:hypothetical protein